MMMNKPQTPPQEPSVPRTKLFSVIGCSKCHRMTPHRLLGPIQFDRRSQDAKAPIKCLICRRTETRWLHKDGKDVIELTREDPRESRPAHEPDLHHIIMRASPRQKQRQRAEQMAEIVGMAQIFPAFAEEIHKALDRAFDGIPEEVTPPSN